MKTLVLANQKRGVGKSAEGRSSHPRVDDEANVTPPPHPHAPRPTNADPNPRNEKSTQACDLSASFI